MHTASQPLGWGGHPSRTAWRCGENEKRAETCNVPHSQQTALHSVCTAAQPDCTTRTLSPHPADSIIAELWDPFNPADPRLSVGWVRCELDRSGCCSPR